MLKGINAQLAINIYYYIIFENDNDPGIGVARGKVHTPACYDRRAGRDLNEELQVLL